MDLNHIKPETVTTMTMAKVKKTSGGKTALTTDGVQGMHKYEK